MKCKRRKQVWKPFGPRTYAYWTLYELDSYLKETWGELYTVPKDLKSKLRLANKIWMDTGGDEPIRLVKNQREKREMHLKDIEKIHRFEAKK